MEQASGQLSLEEFQALEREHERLEELRACGLSDEEIALTLEHEGRQLSNLVYVSQIQIIRKFQTPCTLKNSD